MADISSVSGLSSLSRDLYYQYLINHNPTSTMLNAISGSDNDSSDTSGLMNAVSAGLSSSLGGLTGLNSLTGLMGLGDEENLLGTSQALSSFSDILQTYMSGQTAEAATMAESMSSVLEEAAQTEDTSSLTYRTVQEIYQYFADKSSAPDQTESSIVNQLRGSGAADSAQATAPGQQMAEMDFDALEEQLQQEAEAVVAVPF